MAARRQDALLNALGFQTLVLELSALSNTDLVNLVFDTEFVSSCCLGNWKREAPEERSQRSLEKGDRTGKNRKVATEKKETEHLRNRCTKKERWITELERNFEVEKSLLKTDRVHESEAFLFDIKDHYFVFSKRSLWTLSGENVVINMRYWV